jgi:hypothetical protein
MVDVPLRHTGRSPAGGRLLGEIVGQEPVVVRGVRRRRWPRVIIAAAVAAAALAAAGYGARWGITAYRAGLMVTGLSEDPSPMRVVVGGETIAVPGNMLRDPEARRANELKRAELVLHWPTLEGYRSDLAGDFIDGTPSMPLVYASVAPRVIGLDPEARLDNIYAPHFVGGALAAPSGLTARRLSPESGYGGEIVYYGAAGPGRFVARCIAPASPEIPPTCLRDFHLGNNLTLTYRFHRDILGEWATLDARMRALGASLVQR